MHGTGDHRVYGDHDYFMQNKPSSERQITRFRSYAESRPKINSMTIVKGGLLSGKPEGREGESSG
jgi:hypothetical protein